MSYAVHLQLELARDDADDLLVRVGVFGEGRAGIDLNPRMRDPVRVNQAGAKARKNFPDGQLIEFHDWHA